MSVSPRAVLTSYAVSALASGLALLLRLALFGFVDNRGPFITFGPAIILSAYLGGVGPGLLATLLSAAAAQYFLMEPRYSFAIHDIHDLYAMGLFLLTGAFLSVFGETLLRAQRRIVASERRSSAVLASIGDAVIAADTESRVTFLNPAAEALTGWPEKEAVGQPLAQVFRIINEHTRQPVEDPAANVLRTGKAIGFANDTALLTREGREMLIEDCAAPIIDDRGGLTGVVLVFRDVTHRRQAAAAEFLRRANERMELALRGSSVGVWDIQMPTGDLRRGHRHYVNLWEQLGYEGRSAGGTTLDVAHPDDRAPVEEAARRYLAGETTDYETETRLRHNDGSYRTMLARGVAVRNASGKPIRFVGVTVDITKLKIAEEELRRTSQLLQAVADGTQDAVYVKDREGRHLMFNAAASRMVGKPIGEVLGRDDTAIFDSDSASAVMAHDRRVMESGVPDTDEKDLTTGGVTRSYLAAKAPYRDGQGHIIGIIGICHDITERKRAEESLRESEGRFRGTFENAAVGIAHTDDMGRFLRVNEKLCAIVGYSREELLKKTIQDVTHPDDLSASLDSFSALIRGNALVFGLEQRFLRKDGSPVWIELFASLQRDAAGQPAYAIAVMHDISERKRAEEKFRGLVESAPDAMVIVDKRGEIILVNSQTERMFGYTRAELLGKPVEILMPNRLRDTHSAHRAEYFAEPRVRPMGVGLDLYGLRKDHKQFPIEISLAPLETEEETLVTSSIRDITERKRLEDELRRAVAAAEAANRAKDEFLASVSHEIRTPMNAILGMTELTLDTPLTAEQREYLAIVKSSADSLLKVINDLLDFAKIEAGKLELDYSEFSLRRVLGESLRALAFRAHKKGLELACRISPEVPDALIGDAGRLRQVLLNLIGNAVKFTEHGEVVVQVEAGKEDSPADPDLSAPGSPSLHVLHFSISDTGIGIPREKQERIFRAFEQVDSSTTRRFEGTGLGLSIAARLVSLMGGRITVESEPGRGSTFQFTAAFEARLHSPDSLPEPPLPNLHGLRVLIVDDNATNRQILEEWLRGWHTEPVAVADAFKALDALWSSVSAGRPFALVLLDARMPGADGFAVAESIMRNPLLSQCRVILLTSDDLHADLARYRELGIAACAMKPVPQEELLQIVHEVLSRPDPAAVDAGQMEIVGAASIAADPGSSARRLEILVAEDNHFNQKLAEELLRRRGHNVHVANDGREALAALEQTRFDLMLLDIHMPGCDGFEVIKTLRQREETTGKHLPVIALTARATQSDRDRCLGAGMDDYLAKPISAAELSSALDRVLAGHPKPKPASPTRAQPETRADAAALLAACDNDPVFLHELIEVFRDDAPGELAQLSEAVQEHDSQRLRETAHRLRGMLATFSAKAGEAAAQLEAMGASGAMADADKTLRGLIGLVEQLNPQLEQLSIEQLRRQAAGNGLE
jgi:PAS domain S-box-containing protein